MPDDMTPAIAIEYLEYVLEHALDCDDECDHRACEAVRFAIARLKRDIEAQVPRPER